MQSSELIQRTITEHNEKVKSAMARLAEKRALRAEIVAGFEQHERELKAFNRSILARIDGLIAGDAAEVDELGPPIDMIEQPMGDDTATVLDMAGVLRARPLARREV